eukprot:m.72775 g.72775  ORF g.72775 m.72775 type:complete len:240 (-) comp50250_c0_seq3:206-925(-)
MARWLGQAVVVLVMVVGDHRGRASLGAEPLGHVGSVDLAQVDSADRGEGLVHGDLECEDLASVGLASADPACVDLASADPVCVDLDEGLAHVDPDEGLALVDPVEDLVCVDHACADLASVDLGGCDDRPASEDLAAYEGQSLSRMLADCQEGLTDLTGWTGEDSVRRKVATGQAEMTQPQTSLRKLLSRGCCYWGAESRFPQRTANSFGWGWGLVGQVWRSSVRCTSDNVVRDGCIDEA